MILVPYGKYIATSQCSCEISISALFLPAAVFFSLTSVAGCNGAITLTLFVVAGTLRGLGQASYMCSPVDVAPDYAGTVFGVAVCVANIAGFLVPWTTGLLIENDVSSILAETPFLRITLDFPFQTQYSRHSVTEIFQMGRKYSEYRFKIPELDCGLDECVLSRGRCLSGHGSYLPILVILRAPAVGHGT